MTGNIVSKKQPRHNFLSQVLLYVHEPHRMRVILPVQW